MNHCVLGNWSDAKWISNAKFYQKTAFQMAWLDNNQLLSLYLQY